MSEPAESDTDSAFDLATWKFATILLLAVGQTIPYPLASVKLSYYAGYFVGAVLMLYLLAVIVTVSLSKTGLWLNDGYFKYVSVCVAGLSVLLGVTGYPAFALYILVTPLLYFGGLTLALFVGFARGFATKA